MRDRDHGSDSTAALPTEPTLPARLRQAVVLAPPLTVIGFIAMPYVSGRLFDAFTREDGLVETLQALGLLACCVLSAMVALQRWSMGSRAFAALYGAFALVTLVAAGEEVSWGQRMFEVETPEWYAAQNHQGETTIHNLHGVQEAQGPVVGGTLVILSGLTLWAWRLPWAERLRRQLHLLAPHPMLLMAWACMVGYIVALTLSTASVIELDDVFVLHRLQEPVELILVTGVAIHLAFVRWLDRYLVAHHAFGP